MLLLFVLPAAYCDVTDSVLFPGRRAKILTFTAGVVATTMVWCIVTPLWLLTKPGTLLNDALLISSALTGVANITQFIPLYKFDGHFILASLAGHQDLFEESWQHFRNTLLRPLFTRIQSSLWGPFLALSIFNLFVAALVSASLCGYGSVTRRIITGLLCVGIASLFFQAAGGPLRGAKYDRLKRDFAIYAMIFLFSWQVVAARFLWRRLVPHIQVFGIAIVAYLVFRSLRRNVGIIFGTDRTRIPIRQMIADRPFAWMTPVLFWIVVDFEAAQWLLRHRGFS